MNSTRQKKQTSIQKKWVKPKIREIKIGDQVGMLGCSKANWVACESTSCGGETQT